MYLSKLTSAPSIKCFAVALAAFAATASIAAGETQSHLQVMITAPRSEVRLVAPTDRLASVLPGVTAATSATDAAAMALRRYSNQFNVSDPASEFEAVHSFDYGHRGQVVRFRQLHNGLPIVAGDVVVALTPDKQLQSITAKVTARTPAATAPRITASRAQTLASIAIAKHESVPLMSLMASEPELSVYDPQLLESGSEQPTTLVWKTEISSVSMAQPIRNFVLVDASNGSIALNFSQIETVRNRLTYTANNTSGLQTTLLCNEAQPLCTGGTNRDADLAHKYAGEMYDFYFTRFGRDSYDNLGSTLIATVQSTYTGCPNAAWVGTQMVYCAGAPQADDVVAHELTHGVTSATSKLFYYAQSGAINESISDIFGEILDLTNTTGTDTPAVRWKLGEDFAGTGAIRDMRNPPFFGDPDRMTSPLYWTALTDNAGVHTNSGIGNKAAYLMADGDSFNGIRIDGIGLEKVARVFYEANTHYLTSGSDYADLALALNQSCRGLIGTNAFTASDCVQVANAVDAVEMSKAPIAHPNNQADLCPVGQTNTDAYYDSFEALPSPTGWSTAALSGTALWSVATSNATQGTHAYSVSALATSSDSVLFMNASKLVPANAFMHFRHAFVYETNSKGSGFYDGGVVEYSINNGATWTDAGSLISGGIAYGGSLAIGNPLSGRSAFVNTSYGYGSTKLNLAALAGQQIRFRFRNATDSSTMSALPWVIDEVRIYTCATNTAPNALPVAVAGPDQTVKPLASVTLDGSLSNDPDGALTGTQWSQVSGPQLTLSNLSSRYISFTAPIVATQGTAVLRLTATDNRGATSFDEVSINIINSQPVSNAGVDQTTKPRQSVNLAGSGVDSDGTVVSYSWAQVSGPAVTLSSPQTQLTSFTVPSVAATSPLTFRLTTVDNYGGTGIDDVVITAVNDQPVVAAGPDQSVAPGASFTLSASGSDPDGSVVSTSWTQISGPSVVISGASNASIALTAPSSSQAATLVFRFTATDNDGGTSSDDVSVSVNAVPETGTASEGGGGGGGGGFDGLDLGLLALLAAGVQRARRKQLH